MNTRCDEKQQPVSTSVLLPAVPSLCWQTLVLLHHLMFLDKELSSVFPAGSQRHRDQVRLPYSAGFNLPPFLESPFMINRNGSHG
eukprot:COSAG06_NODE_1798_length_8368_cov_4.946668_10_plen_85_part_00